MKKIGAHAWLKKNWYDQQFRYLWHVQGSLIKRKKMRRETASRYTVSQLLKGTYSCKKDRWHGIGSDNPEKCDQKDAW